MRTTQEVADFLVSACRKGDFESPIEELYGANIVSIEPEGAQMREAVGKEAVIEKGKQFNEMVEEFHGIEVSDPVVADNFFAVSMKMDVTYKGAPRMTMEEVCLYQVDDGKIIREEFSYTPPPKQD